MNKIRFIKNLALLGLIGFMAGCSTSYADPVKADPYLYGSLNHYDLRVNGRGYTAEQYSKVYNENFDYKYVVNNVRALVVPVDFTDYKAEDMPKGADGTKEDLRKVMFGTSEENGGWYSLSGYYDSSSYGTCKVTGTVLDWYHIEMTSTAFQKEYASGSHGYVSGSDEVAKEIQDYYNDHPEALGDIANDPTLDYNNDGVVNLKDFDANGDGYVDTLIMIYSHDITTTGEMWWAYCSSKSGTGTSKIKTWVYRYFWASYYFFYDTFYTESMQKVTPTKEDIAAGKYIADSHTMIHEFGHCLSLPDYYVTDYNGNDFAGLGNLDMMDNNIGDHNAFSKSLYGWIDPYVVTKATQFTLHSTTDTGEYIIIPAKKEGFKNTLLDQYIMVEFLTPTGVAKQDGETKYRGYYPQYYSEAGIRISLVDARLGKYTYNSTTSTWNFNGFQNSLATSSNYEYIDFACDNTGSDSCFKDYKLIEVLPSNGQRIKSNHNDRNTWLYKAGDVFGKGECWPNYQMHDKSGGWTTPFGWTISIDAIDGNNTATITIK